jgi:hypothetical protein
MAKKILVWFWGALEACSIWILCLISPNNPNNSNLLWAIWTVNMWIFIASTGSILCVIIKLFYDNWDKEGD